MHICKHNMFTIFDVVTLKYVRYIIVFVQFVIFRFSHNKVDVHKRGLPSAGFTYRRDRTEA
jgi:hypothetical protein